MRETRGKEKPVEKELTKAQKTLLSNMFEGGNTEKEALESAGISSGLYARWLRTPEWVQAFRGAMESCRRQAQLILCNYLVFAAAKLVQLTQCESLPVARQSCLDILEMKSLLPEIVKPQTEHPKEPISQKAFALIVKALSDEQSEKPTEVMTGLDET
jgi:hypothetical protein